MLAALQKSTSCLVDLIFRPRPLGLRGLLYWFSICTDITTRSAPPHANFTLKMMTTALFAITIIENLLERILFDAIKGITGKKNVLEELATTISSRKVRLHIVSEISNFPQLDNIAQMMAYIYA